MGDFNQERICMKVRTSAIIRRWVKRNMSTKFSKLNDFKNLLMIGDCKDFSRGSRNYKIFQRCGGRGGWRGFNEPKSAKTPRL